MSLVRDWLVTGDRPPEIKVAVDTAFAWAALPQVVANNYWMNGAPDYAFSLPDQAPENVPLNRGAVEHIDRNVFPTPFRYAYNQSPIISAQQLITHKLRTQEVVRALDIGTGGGDFVAQALQNPGVEALGLSASDMRNIRPNNQLPADAYVLGNIEDLEPTDVGGQFDVIVARASFPYCADPARTLARVHDKFLAPGGLMVVDHVSLYGVGQELVPFLSRQESLVDTRYLWHTRDTDDRGVIPSFELEDLVIQKTVEPWVWPLAYNGTTGNQYADNIPIAAYSFCG